MIIKNIKTEIAKRIKKTILKNHLINSYGELDISASDIIPALKDFGDFAYPCFKLSKLLKKNPVEIAKNIENFFKIDSTDSHLKNIGDNNSFDSLPNSILFEKVSAINGYINFIINKVLLLKMIYLNTYNHSFIKFNKQNKTFMIEYSSPNTNKPLHLGHLRNNILGMAISNLLKFVGYNIIRANLYNDRGIGISEVIYDYITYHYNEKPKIKPDHYVGNLYSEFNNKLKENPKLYDEIKIIVQKWENHDPEIIKIWKKLRTWVLEGYKQTYDLLGSKFDVEYFESELYIHGKKIVENAYTKGLLKKTNEGAIYAPLKQYGLADKILIKSDGTALYATTDIYLAKRKFDDFKLDKSIYIVASEQDLYFKQLFKIIEILNLINVDNIQEKLYHLSYGLVSLPSGRLKSREGTKADIDDLYQEIFNLAKEELIKRGLNVPTSEELNNRASKIALAAMKFYIVKVETFKNMIYDPKTSLSFEGETGPYLLYTYARIKSIFRKLKINPEKYIYSNYKILNQYLNKINFNELSTIENKIILQLSYFPTMIKESALNYKPNLLARYLIDLAQAYNNFYHAYNIIKENKQHLKEIRLLISYLVSFVLSKGLSLLDISVIEEM